MNQPNKIRQGFIALAETLLKSVVEVFPECEASETALHIFETLVKGNEQREDSFIHECAVLFKKHSAELKNHEEEALFVIAEQLPVLRDINLREKWTDPGFGTESKDHLWQYLQALKTYAELYCSVPRAVMGKIEHVAGTIGDRLKNGELDLAKLDISSVGKELLGQLSPEELQTFEGNLPSIFSSISEVAGALAAQAGHPELDVAGLMKKVVQGQAGGPSTSNIDVASVLQQVGSLLAPGEAGRRPEPGVDQLMSLAQSFGPLLQQGVASGATSASLTPDMLTSLMQNPGLRQLAATVGKQAIGGPKKRLADTTSCTETSENGETSNQQQQEAPTASFGPVRRNHARRHKH